MITQFRKNVSKVSEGNAACPNCAKRDGSNWPSTEASGSKVFRSFRGLSCFAARTCDVYGSTEAFFSIGSATRAHTHTHVRRRKGDFASVLPLGHSTPIVQWIYHHGSNVFLLPLSFRWGELLPLASQTGLSSWSPEAAR